MRKGLIFMISIMANLTCFGQDWTEVPQLVDDDAFAVDIGGNYAIVGDKNNNTDANNDNNLLRAGAAFIYEWDGNNNWNLVQKIVASDRSSTDGFGVAVAISAEGVAVVGTEARETAYVFEYDGNQWVEVQKLAPGIFQNDDNYGRSIAIHEDKLIVGAPFRRLSDTETPGAAYLYARDGTTGSWTEVKEIAAPSTDNGSFGADVDISENLCVIGAPNTDHPDGDLSIGAVYVYSATTGNLESTLDFPFLQPGDKFGSSVAISGTTVITGLEAHALDEAGADDVDALDDGLLHPGIVGVFSGATWGLQKIVSPNRIPNGQFGFSVDIWNETAIVGANQEGLDADGGDFKPFAGVAYVLERSAGGAWGVTQKITPSNRDPFDKFGTRVAMEGNRALILGEEKAFAFKACSEVAVPDIESTSTDICAGQSITLSISGDGVEGTTWFWHAGNCGGPLLATGASVDFTPDVTTTYFVRNGDRCGTPFECKSITINITDNLDLAVTITNEMSGDDGTIDLTVSGGDAPYEYDWDNDGTGDFDDSEDLTGLPAGIYHVIVRDNNGCINNLEAEVEGGTITNLPNDLVEDEVTVYPNPVRSGNIQVNVGRKPVDLNILDSRGKKIGFHTITDETRLNLTHLPRGVYVLQFIMKDKVQSRWLLKQ